MVRLRRALAVSAVMALAGPLMVAGEAHAAVAWKTFWNLKSSTVGEQLVMAVAGDPGAPAETPIVVKRLDSRGNQLWYFEQHDDSSAIGTYFIIRSAGTSAWQALSVKDNSSANGAKIIQYAYQPTNKFQQWTLESENLSYGPWKNVATGKCLAVAGGTGNIAPLAAVILYSCGSGDDQQWMRFSYP